MKIVAIFVLAMAVGYYAGEANKAKEGLRVMKSVVYLLDEQIKELTAVPHKGVRPHLRKNGEVK